MNRQHLLIKFFMIMGLCLSNIAYCDNDQDAIYKEEYSFIPSEAMNISVQETSRGVFIHYSTKNYWNLEELIKAFYWNLDTIFLSEEGEVRNLKEELIKALLLTRPELLAHIDIANFNHFFDKVSIYVNDFNNKAQAVGVLYFSSNGFREVSLPFFWSPNECGFLPALNPCSLDDLDYDQTATPRAINNHGIIVGFDQKIYKKTIYVGKAKNKKEILCKKRVPVVWTFDSVKEIVLYLDSKDESRYLDENFYELSIDDENYIRFQTEGDVVIRAGSIHLSELD